MKRQRLLPVGAGAQAQECTVITLLSPREQLTAASTTDREHIICPCRFRVTYCGAFDESPVSDEDVDGTECPQCLEVWPRGCPNCGCKPDEYCDQCDVEDSDA